MEQKNRWEEAINKICLSDAIYDKIEKRYKSIGDWLNRKESSVKEFNPKIYSQGSIRTGTAITPLKDGSYDVDLVCQLDIDETKKTPKELKEIVGNEIKAYMKSSNMSADIHESKRCWTVNYADEISFHVDVLPAIHDKFNKSNSINWKDTAIIITDNTFSGYNKKPGEWAYSNPIGFSEWLKDIELNSFIKKEKEQLNKRKIETIPEYLVLTPLKKCIMILKRHRDVFFKDNPDFKPSSVLITTLSGLSYKGSNLENIWKILKYIVNNIDNHIKNINGVASVLNPSNNLENFTDKWVKRPDLKKYFYIWLNALKSDLNDMITFESKLSIQKSINECISYIEQHHHIKEMEIEKITTSYKCKIKNAEIKNKNGLKNHKDYKSGGLINRGLSIKFTAETDVPEPYVISWRVINTGEDAEIVGDLRGSFSENKNFNSLIHVEKTKYRGIHSIECLVLKDDKIVAESGKFIVIIR